MSLEIDYRALQDELTKIAFDTLSYLAGREAGVNAERQPPSSGLSTGGKVLGGAGLFMGSNIAGQMSKNLIAPRLLEGVKPSGGKMGLRDVINLRKDLSPTTAVGNATHPFSSMYIPKGGMMPKVLRPLEQMAYDAAGVSRRVQDVGFQRGAVNAPLGHSPEFLSHELGHASLRDPNKTGRLLRTLIKGRAAGGVGGLAAGSAMAMQDPESMTAQLAPAAVAAGWAPTMVDEGLASYRGLKAVGRLGKYSPEAMKLMRGNLLRAGGTYGALAAGTILPTLAVTQWRKRNAQQARQNPQG